MLEPCQKSPPHPPYYSSEHISLIHKELKNFRNRQFNSWNILQRQGSCPTYSYSPQERWAETSNKPQSPQPICQHQAIQNGGYLHHKSSLETGDWLAKVDLKSTCFAIPIHLTHRRHLKFQILGNVYLFTCLPFGLLLLKSVLVLFKRWNYFGGLSKVADRRNYLSLCVSTAAGEKKCNSICDSSSSSFLSPLIGITIQYLERNTQNYNSWYCSSHSWFFPTFGSGA